MIIKLSNIFCKLTHLLITNGGWSGRKVTQEAIALDILERVYAEWFIIEKYCSMCQTVDWLFQIIEFICNVIGASFEFEQIQLNIFFLITYIFNHTKGCYSETWILLESTDLSYNFSYLNVLSKFWTAQDLYFNFVFISNDVIPNNFEIKLWHEWN